VLEFGDILRDFNYTGRLFGIVAEYKSNEEELQGIGIKLEQPQLLR